MSLALDQVAAVVLAGGHGTRIRHLLPGLPKPMAPVAGKPFLEWVVRYLARQGVRRVVLSTGYLAEVVERHFQNCLIPGVKTQCVAEAAALGTAGGFLNAVRMAGGDPAAWLVMNGDSLVFAELASLAVPLADPGISAVVMGRQVPDASRYGTLKIGPSGELLQFAEKRPGEGIINAGVYLMRPALVREFPNKAPLSLEQDVFPMLISRGFRLGIVRTEAPFLDIGTPESLPQAETFIRENLRQFADI